MNPVEQKNWQVGIGVFNDNIKEDRRKTQVDRRSASRLSFSLPIRYHVQDSPKDWQSVEALDVSLTGVRIVINQPVTVNSVLDLDIKLPGIEKPFHVTGTVKWVEPAFNDTSAVECGVAFHNVKQMPRKDHFISFMADKFCHLNTEQKTDLIARPASTVSEIKTAFKIIHKEYVKRGYCKAQTSEMFYTYFSLLPNSRTFVLEKENAIHGTLSLIPDSPCGLPMERLFPEEIAKLRAEGRKVAENSMLALDQEILGHGLFSLTHSEKHLYFFSLVKMMIDTAKSMGITDILIAVHPKHEALYRFLTFETIGPVKSYQGALGNPALPMRWQIDNPVKGMPEDSGVRHYFSQPSADAAVLSSYVQWDEEAITELLLPIWDKVPAEAKEYLGTLYPTFEETGVRIKESEVLYESETDVDTYASNTHWGPMAWLENAFVKDVIKKFKGQKNINVLDVCSGPAWISMNIAKSEPTWNVTGLDYSDMMIGKAKAQAAKRGIPIEFVQGRAQDTGLPSGQFDLIVNHLAFHEFDHGEEIIAEMMRLLKPGGRIVIQDLERPKGFRMTLTRIWAALSPYSQSMKRQHIDSLLAAHSVPEVKRIMALSGVRATVHSSWKIVGPMVRIEIVKPV